MSNNKKIYYKISSGATAEMTEESYKNLNKKMQSKWREANEAEIKVHNARIESRGKMNERQARIQKNNKAKASGNSVKSTSTAKPQDKAKDKAPDATDAKK